MQPAITPDVLRAAMPQSTQRNTTRFAQELTATMARYSIDNALRAAHFLAQVAQESGQLAFTEEIASGAEYEDRRDLGNVEPGDGVRFKGRGLIQVTGRSNYLAYSSSRKEDFVSGEGPARIANEPLLAADVAGWFWQLRGLNALADVDDVVRITRRVNGGLTGLPQRQHFLALAKLALAHSAAASSSTVAAGTAAHKAASHGTLPSVSASSDSRQHRSTEDFCDADASFRVSSPARKAPVAGPAMPARDNPYQDAA